MRPDRHIDRGNAVLKRILDVVLATAGLLVCLPLTGFLWLFHRPVFFRQRRIGLDEREFEVVKFRSMDNRRDSARNLLPDDQRITKIGRLLRATSLDEIPQFWNVLKGEMSLVGPRPLLAEYLPRYSEFQRRRHLVRPGMTGWAQVQGRNSVDWETKFALDVYYVGHSSLALDLKILLLTFVNVILGRGVNPADDLAVPKFMGSQKSQSGLG